ncbi:nuclear protein DGCR14 [Aspergillus ambiguus]|uniref:splicing factor ESS-2 family protein n=1 Tax=Aspergillus ambiguus TaxID=176160 RepID=UPI003CCD7DFE
MASPSQALDKRQNATSLMPPPPPPKRIKRPATVLDEDVYTQALSDIIARDYFPGLLEEQVKQEYLDALDSKDKEWISASKQKLSDLMRTPGRARGRPAASATPRFTSERPGDTPTGWGGDTPMSVMSSSSSVAPDSASSKPSTPDVSRLGLLDFQAKYTSEDNESFNKLLDRQNSKRREKHAWLWAQNKIPSARQIAHRNREAKRIEAQGRLPAIKSDLDARPANPDSWSSASATPDNALMFMPSSIEDSHETIAQKAEAASRAAPKRVVYQNTRLPDDSTLSPAAASAPPPPSPSLSAIHDAIAGRPRPTDSDPGASHGGETPRVNGYAFVDEDEPPSTAAAPGNGNGNGNDDETPDLRLLGTADATPNPFQIRETRRREALHHRMVDRVARNKRIDRAARDAKTPITAASPSWPSSPRLDFTPRGKMLTPAAQNLLQRVGRTPRAGSSASAAGTRDMWTPTPRRR